MSKLETPLTRKYWQQVGGTLIEEFQAVKKSPTNGPRYIDGVIIKDGKNRIAKQNEVSIEGKDIICIQTKAKRLGMPLMGQTLFSIELLKKFNPKSITAVALCTKDDSVLRPLMEKYSQVKVEIMDSL